MHPPNLWHLQVFLDVIERGSVTRAAAALGLTQPAASQALKGLGEHYGADLTARRGDRIAATAEGEMLRSRGSVAIGLLTEGLKEAAGLKANPEQVLRAMSARRLETLVSIVRHGGFSGAARAEGYAAPTVHRAAKDLEKALKVTLFERTSHGVRPTKQAELLALKAGLAFSELRQAAAEIAGAKGHEAGGTVIGAMPLARAHLVPAAVAAFSATHEDHKVSIIDGAYEDLLIALRRGEADLLVGALRENPALKDVVEQSLFDDSLSIVMRAGHPAAEEILDGMLLMSFPWIAPRATSPLRVHFDAMFRALNAPPPEDVIECNSLSAARVILMNSDRLMLLSDEQIRYEKAAKMLISRPHPVSKVVRTIGLTMRRNWRPTEAQAALLAEIKRKAQETVG
ncbi:LysR family transcriptional regulator [Hyphococcus sp.]|jgi:DNA-binding transcriptional LysR family regulator|uniref:LysR family transcriptional regulator n=1 Tax=Hyphococcus sp. TaxID=2038636 RepID=UPI003D0BAD34